MELNIINFNHEHIKRAMEIALMNYEEERRYVPELPKVASLPDLSDFADNGLGVTAFEGNRMIGYLCAYRPMEDAFRTTNVRGTFSPIHAHGVIPESLLRLEAPISGLNRDRIYSLLYQAAADKWVKAGIQSHAIALYTHDKDAEKSFFYNGFGLRCIDAIRSLDNIPETLEINLKTATNLEYCEVPKGEWGLLLEKQNGLIAHLGDSPTFMKFAPMNEEDLYQNTSDDIRYFAVKADGRYIAYVKIGDEGENFATEVPQMMNICGAYCEPEYRGSKIYHNLLCYLMQTLKKEGNRLLGVDCESFNPTARGFWLKYFAEYTHSVVRRIDDKAINKETNE